MSFNQRLEPRTTPKVSAKTGVSLLFSKPRVEDFRRLAIFSLQRDGSFSAGISGILTWRDIETNEETGRIGYSSTGHSLRLNYKLRFRGGDWQDFEDTIHLSKTYPHFGGERYWFICPNCLKRRGVLYAGTYFRCRECYGACYQTQLEDAKSRALTKVFKRRRGLGGFGGLDEPFPFKPKGMRWATYERLRQADMRDCGKVFRLEGAWLAGLRRRLGA